MKISAKLKISFAIVMSFSTQQAVAYTPIPLTPSWFSTIKNNLLENTQNVWRGTVFDAPTPTTLLLKNPKGEVVTLNLMHLSAPPRITDQKVAIMNNASKSLIGMQVYVLGKNSKNSLSAKILDMDGNDINLRFISSGFYDLNTSSLLLKPEKQQYLNAWHSAQRTHVGIWKTK